MIHQISVGLTALRAAQIGLDVVGQNLANANTLGYTRQRALLVDRGSVNTYGLEQGIGVEVAQIRRAYSSVLEQAVMRYTSDNSHISTQLQHAQQLESIFAFRDGSLPREIDALFNQLEELSARPDDATLRNQVVRSAQSLVNSIQRNASDMDRLVRTLSTTAKTAVDRVNVLNAEISDLNKLIGTSKLQGRSPNDLMDRRGALINELSTFVDVQLNEAEDSLVLGGGALLVGAHRPPTLELRQVADGWAVYRQGSTARLDVGQGSIGATLNTINETVPEYGRQLDQLALGLIEALDTQHALGLGVHGSFSLLVGQRRVHDVDAMLGALPTNLPIHAGTLTINLLNESTGERTLHRVEIDPKTDSLRAVADRISQIDNLQAVVDSQTGRLSIMATPGFRFDFSGRPQTYPNTSSLSGSSIPSIDGVFTGPHNDELRLEFAGSGQIGVTQNLSLEVRSSDGTLIESVQVGEGYSPGQPITLGNGLRVSLSSGTVVAGESFHVDAVRNGDTSGLLVTLGMNTFFAGDSARTLSVHADLVPSADRLATSITGEVGDSTNLTRILARREEALSVLGNRSTATFSHELTVALGSQVQSLTQSFDSLSIVAANLEAQRHSISGVDPDEEITQMLLFQRSYQAAARYLASVSQTTQEIMLLIQ